MKINTAREAWFLAYYQPWNSVLASAVARAELGKVEGAGYVRRKATETMDGEEVTYWRWVYAGAVAETRQNRPSTTTRCANQALAGRIQQAIDTLPAHLQAFGHHMYNPLCTNDHREVAESIVFHLAYVQMDRMTASKRERAEYVANGVLYRYRRQHQGGQSACADPLAAPEAFRAWLDDEYGVRLASENWTRDWSPFVQASFYVCNDLDRQALAPVASVIGEMKAVA